MRGREGAPRLCQLLLLEVKRCWGYSRIAIGTAGEGLGRPCLKVQLEVGGLRGRQVGLANQQVALSAGSVLLGTASGD